MSVKKDASGLRSVQVEVEAPDSPEEVWQAIATGPGISSWFVPTEVEERVGGAVTFHLGPGMDSLGTVTAWEPPFRLAYEERDWSPNAPPLATECILEARSGGACIVRMVHSLFTSSDDWDDQLESFESGWPSFFHILQLYLTHFRGERGSAFRVTGSATGSESEAWEALTGALGLAGATKGQQRNAPASGVPLLAGIIERTGEGKHVHELTLRLDRPTPGVAWLGVYTWGGKVQATIGFYLFGDRAPVISARDEPLWHARSEAAIRPNKQALALLLFWFSPPISRPTIPRSEHTAAPHLADHQDQIECFSHLA
jgi:uncharacterized protein YndB with AHSA1/START domain